MTPTSSHTLLSYARQAESQFGPPSEPINVAEFILSCVDSPLPDAGNLDELLNDLSPEEKQALEEDCEYVYLKD